MWADFDLLLPTRLPTFLPTNTLLLSKALLNIQLNIQLNASSLGEAPTQQFSSVSNIAQTAFAPKPSVLKQARKLQYAQADKLTSLQTDKPTV